MRDSERMLAIAAREHWAGNGETAVSICPLIADLDEWLWYLRDIELVPGRAIDRCPACAGEHRWVLIRALLVCALDLRPADRHPLLRAVARSQNRNHARDGGNATRAAAPHSEGASGTATVRDTDPCGDRDF